MIHRPGVPSRRARIVLRANILVILLVSQGCSSIAKHIDDEQVARIEIGQSSRDEVLNMLGLPSRTERRAFQGEELELWIYDKGKGIRTYGIVIPAPIVNTAWWVLFTNSITVDEREALATVVAFNEAGTVVDVKENADAARR